MMTYIERADKVNARIDELAAITEKQGIIKRTFGSDALGKAAEKVKNWMKEAGMEARVDNIGNVRGRLQGNHNMAKTLVIASHIDTVVNAGKFDGPMGVVAAIDLVEEVVRTGRPLPFNIEVIAFCDEEGVRFHTTYLGSKWVAGTITEEMLAKTDEQGVTVQDVIEQAGGTIHGLKQDMLTGDELLAYYEVHIEQGPVLYEGDVPVGVVTNIAGQRRLELTFTGETGHAGTVPMNMRADALCCAAECITAIEEYAQDTQADVVATVGKLDIVNSASNVIPGKVWCTLDLRSAENDRLTFACNAITNIIKEICEDRNIVFEWKLVQETKPVACDADLRTLLEQSINDAGYDIAELVSGAGHDAVPMSAIGPVAMLFVRCYKGISHNPLEQVEVEDVAAALQVSDNFINYLTTHFKV